MYLKKTPANGFYNQIVDTSELLISHMLIGRVHPLIDDLSQAIMFSLDEILCYEKVKNKVWCLDQVHSQNILQLQM